VPGLIHDGPLGRARNSRTRGVTGPQTAARILGGIQTRAECQLLDHARHIDRAEPAGLEVPMAIQGAEQRTGTDGSLLQPRRQRAQRAGVVPWCAARGR